MQLEKLRIQRKSYGKDEGKFLGSIEFRNDLGSIALRLNSEQCDNIFNICADGVLTVAKEAAEEMTCRVIEHSAPPAKEKHSD